MRTLVLRVPTAPAVTPVRWRDVGRRHRRVDRCLQALIYAGSFVGSFSTVAVRSMLHTADADPAGPKDHRRSRSERDSGRLAGSTKRERECHPRARAPGATLAGRRRLDHARDPRHPPDRWAGSRAGHNSTSRRCWSTLRESPTLAPFEAFCSCSDVATACSADDHQIRERRRDRHLHCCACRATLPPSDTASDATAATSPIVSRRRAPLTSIIVDPLVARRMHSGERYPLGPRVAEINPSVFSFGPAAASDPRPGREAPGQAGGRAVVVRRDDPVVIGRVRLTSR